MTAWWCILPVVVLAAAGLLPAAAVAHPHVFVDTGLKLALDDQGRVTGVEVRWEYDELYSMGTFQDNGLDNDYDGQLTAAEMAALDGFDLSWISGYDGDLYLMSGTDPVALAAPEGRGVTVRDGRILSTHFRPLPRPVPAEGLVIRAYDPSFYTAYGLTLGIEVGGGCRAEVTQADPDKATALLENLLASMPSDTIEGAFPEVGEAFADTAVIRCGG